MSFKSKLPYSCCQRGKSCPSVTLTNLGSTVLRHVYSSPCDATIALGLRPTSNLATGTHYWTHKPQVTDPRVYDLCLPTGLVYKLLSKPFPIFHRFAECNAISSKYTRTLASLFLIFLILLFIVLLFISSSSYTFNAFPCL